MQSHKVHCIIYSLIDWSDIKYDNGLMLRANYDVTCAVDAQQQGKHGGAKIMKYSQEAHTPII